MIRDEECCFFENLVLDDKKFYLLIIQKMTKKKIVLLALACTLSFGYFAKAGNHKLYIANGKLNYQCPDGVINPSTDLGIDMNSVKILSGSADNAYFIDKNKVYVVTEDSHSHTCSFNVVVNADPNTFKVLNNVYQKDGRNVFSNDFYWGWGVPTVARIANFDISTFVAVGGNYAKDVNNVYYNDRNAGITLGTGSGAGYF